MRKIVFALSFTALLLIGFSGVSHSAMDWSKFESGRDNIRLDGYKSQPGYISFTDGDGTVIGYVFGSSDGKLYWQSKTAGTVAQVAAGTHTVTGINLKTTEIGTVGGEIPLW